MGAMVMHNHFAPLGLWLFLLDLPRALPWAIKFCAFGTERSVTVLPHGGPARLISRWSANEPCALQCCYASS